jgi:methanogenic corrinoid protein MtbC1
MESLPQDRQVREDEPHRAASVACGDAGSLFGATEAANDTHLAQLARAIEYEIIPRLMLAHRAGAVVTDQLDEPAHRFTQEEVVDFGNLVMAQDEGLALAAIQVLRQRDVGVEHIYLGLLAPTARYLGDLWNDDRCTFTDVTVGLGRLQRVLRELSPALGAPADLAEPGRRVLLLPGPGEQHTFGLLMVGEFFRRSGWHVTGGAWTAGADAPTLVAGEGFDVIGFSLGAEVHLVALARLIAAVRNASCNRALVVLVGGPLFAEHPEFVARLGADGMTIDGREAPSLADRLVTKATGRRDIRG